MKTLTIFIILISLIEMAIAQVPEYDSTLAKSLGADELGMKTYVLVILKSGTAVITDTAIRAKLFRGHFENINKLAEEGKLLTAGPIDANEQQFRGIFLFNVTDTAEVKELLKGDPTIVQHIFEPLYFLLYGSAAFQEIPRIHRKIQKKELK
jgi:uncharacterized protein YciI